MPLPPTVPALGASTGRNHACRGLVCRRNPVNAAALHQDRANRRQRGLEQSPAPRPC